MPNSAEFLINLETERDQDGAAVTVMANGGFAVAWTSGDSANSDIAARLFTGLGAGGAEIAVNGTTGDRQNAPDIQALSDGRLAVVWQDYTDVSQPILRLRMLEGDGSFATATTYAGFGGADLRSNGTLAALDDGSFALVTQNVDNHTYYSLNVDIQVRDSAGQVIVGSTPVNETGGASYSTEVTRLSDGNLAVVWRVYLSGNGPYQTHARIVTPEGTPVTDEFTISGPSASDKHDFQLSALGGGRFVVVWSDESRAMTDKSSAAVYGQIWNGDGTAHSAVFLVNETSQGLQTTPSVTTLDNGRFCVAWTSGPDYSNMDAFYRIFDGDGTPAGHERELNLTLSGNQTNAALATLADGRVIATWTDYSEQLGDPWGGIVGRILDFRTQSVTMAGTVQNDAFVGTGLHDSLSGRAGSDSLVGGGGNDLISGGADADLLMGGAGDDTLMGGAGSDTAVFAVASGVTLDLRLTGLQETGAGADLLSGIENVATGNGDDLLRGNAAANAFVAQGGSDTVAGGRGDDWIAGGAGQDVLTGGAGADVFVYAQDSGTRADTITDFSAARGDGFALIGLVQGTFAYLGEAGFTAGGHGEARFGGGKVAFDFDGDGARDLVVWLEGVLSADQLTGADFLIL